MKHAILVVGTGRSGTSAMAGTLQILGAYLGEALKPADAYNARGYFENTQITDLNKEILLAVGLSWYQTPPELVRPVFATREFIEAISARISSVFGERSPVAIKDPRFCVLLDVYVTALRAMDYEVHCVRMLRDPVEVTRSLVAAAGPNERWATMIRRHADLLVEALERNCVDCVDSTFAEFVERPETTVKHLVKQLPFLQLDAARTQSVLNFVDRALRHHGHHG